MIIHGKEAQEKLLEGIDLVANTIKHTLGPKARTVILETNGIPIVINDGVTIAKAISSDDVFIQMGVELLQSVASQAQENAGDGTTTASVLTQAILKEYISNEKNLDPIETKRILQDLTNKICEVLDEQAQPVSNNQDLEWIASIAANNDNKLGGLIAHVMESIGHDGIITVEKGQRLETIWESVEGMELDRGYMNYSMITNQEKGECELTNPLIMMCNHEIVNFQNLLPALEISVKESRPLLILAKEIEGNAYPNLLMNIMQKTFKGCAVKAPDWGDDQIEILKDLSSLVGGKVFINELGDNISKITLEDLGSANSIKINKDKTIIVVEGDKKQITQRIDDLKGQIKTAPNDWVEEKLMKRLGKLTGGVAVIKVGAATEIEMKETMERLDDALNATKAAIQEGVIVGGGLALWNACNKVIGKEIYEEDIVLHNKVRSILQKTCYVPMLQIAHNAGHTLDKYKLKDTHGYNAHTNEYCNLMEAGVIDPVKVVKSSIQTAISVASLIITTEALVSKKEEEPIMGSFQ
tara:strand:+ start:5856 stop:7433 length:1578 start_codon:yes stop_codon:yes gene_type:complete